MGVSLADINGTCLDTECGKTMYLNEAFNDGGNVSDLGTYLNEAFNNGNVSYLELHTVQAVIVGEELTFDAIRDFPKYPRED